MQIPCPTCGSDATVDPGGSSVHCTVCGSEFDVPTVTRELGDTPQLAKTQSQAAETPAPREWETPERIGKYRILREAQRGGFGIVYKALDEGLDRFVAIKIPRPDRQTRSTTAQYLQEARSAAHLNHSNIVTVYEAGVFRDTVYIAMEWIDGQPLADLVAGQRPWQEVCRLIATVAEAVHFAHKRGFVHRDIKPANILLAEDDTPYLADFGLAVHEEVQDKLRGQIAGTGPYMSPEQVRGEVDFVDGRTDIWSLGVTLYYLLTGKRPFTATGEQLAEQILRRAPKPLRQIDDRLPEEVEQLVFRCLEKEPERRLATAADLAAGLRAALGEPARTPWKSTLARGAAGVVILVAVALLASAWSSREPAAGGPPPQQTRKDEVKSPTPPPDPTRAIPERLLWPEEAAITLRDASLDLQCDNGEAFVLFSRPSSDTYELRMTLVQQPMVGRFAVILGYGADGFHKISIAPRTNQWLVAHNFGTSIRGGMKFAGSRRTAKVKELGTEVRLRVFVRTGRLAGLWINDQRVELATSPGAAAEKISCAGRFGLHLNRTRLKLAEATINGKRVRFRDR